MTAMRRNFYYPLYLDLSGKRCVVVGGGRVAERKVRALLGSGARVHVVSPRVSRGIRTLRDGDRIGLRERAYASSDLRKAALVFAATNDAETNKRVSEDARERGLLVNVADSPELCDFITPSIVRRGPVTIAISTSGLLPMLAKRLRREIVERLSKEYAQCAVKVGALRKLLMEQVGDRKKRQQVLKEISRIDVSELAAMSMKELRARFLK
jgi:precorrin-2 dehydrogenase/sirohydrochlorin ferrochelatase